MRYRRFPVMIGVVLALSVCVPQTWASTVTYLGEDVTTSANWRTASTIKPAAFDPDGDNVYGSDGYVVAVDTVDYQGNNGSVLTSLPTYLSNVTTPTAPPSYNMYGGTGVGLINDPDAVSQPTDIGKCSWTYQAGASIVGVEYDLFTFTLSEDGTFVLGVIHNPAGKFNVTLPQLRVRDSSGGEGDSGYHAIGTIENSSKINYDFFLVSGVAGDEFTVSETAGWNGATSAGVNAEGLTFEAVPEPTSLALMGLTGACLAARRRRRA